MDIANLIGDRQRRGHPVVVEVGCGNAKQIPNAIGVDIRDLPGVDVVGDAFEVLRQIPDHSVDEIHSSHFLEHIDDLEGLLRESARVTRPGGWFIATVPHFSNPYYYSDPTHRQPFGLYTMAYLCSSSFTSRTVPKYSDPVGYDYVSAEYHFKSRRPHYFRHALKQRGRIFNRSPWFQEWYEEKWVWRLPAHEVTFRLRRREEQLG